MDGQSLRSIIIKEHGKVSSVALSLESCMAQLGPSRASRMLLCIKTALRCVTLQTMYMEKYRYIFKSYFDGPFLLIAL
jgi:hypothetical protein